MTTNEELIAEAREAAPLAMTPEYQAKLLRKMADALESVSAPVEVTERERLARTLFIASDDFAYADRMAKAWDAPGPHGRARWYRYADAVLAAGFRAPAADSEAEWAETLVNDGEFEYTISGDCDGSNVKHWKRTPRRVIEAGKWQQHFPVESEEGAGQYRKYQPVREWDR